MSIDKANERTSKEDSSIDLAFPHKRNSKLDSNVTTLESGRGGGGARQGSSSQSSRPSLLKHIFNALCCISEHNDEKDTVLADLSHAAVTAGGDMTLSGQATNPRYVNAQAPLYESTAAKSQQQPNDKLILDKPVPPLPGTTHDDEHNDRTNLSNTNNDNNFPTNNDRDEVDEDAIRHAATSVQSPTVNNEMLEKTPELEAEDEEELLVNSPPDRWLLEPLSDELAGRKCLVLDLDETLVHSSFKFLPQADFVIPVEIDDQFHNVYVIKRPGVDEFMRRVGELFEVVVFTASVSKYGDPLLDQLDIHNVVHHRLFRESCYNLNGNYVKNLGQLGRPLPDVIIIDNSPASYVLHPQHAVPVSSWFSDAHDNELLDMVPFLEDLAHGSVKDVSQVLDVNIFL